MAEKNKMKKLSTFLLLGLFGCQSAEELKKEQYYAEGYQLYTTNCANCHQDDGKGMANLYPSLTDPTATGNTAKMVCLIKNGTLIVAADTMPAKRPMPGNKKLTELEIAEIITYVKVKWAKDSVFTSIETVAEALKNCPLK